MMAIRYITLIAAASAALVGLGYIIRQLAALARLVTFASDLPTRLHELSVATAANTEAIKALNTRMDLMPRPRTRRAPQ
jgi:hypothetical protein